MMRGPDLELLEEAQVVLEEEAQVVDAVAEHRHPLDAEAEREAGDFGGHPAVVEHLRVDHARPEDLQPAGLLARPAALAVFPARPAAERARDVDLRAGLDEREVARPEARLRAGAEEGAREGGQRALE